MKVDRELLEAIVRCAREEILLRRTSPIVLLIEDALREDDTERADTERAPPNGELASMLDTVIAVTLKRQEEARGM